MKSMAAVLALAALLQQAPAPPGPQHVQKLVLNVTGPTGRYILNLKQEDLIVEENGMEQKITGFIEGSDTPISLGILIDKSMSMRLPLYVEGKQSVPAAILAANRIGRAVVKLMKPQDEYLLMTFDEKLQVRQNFTQDRKKVEDQLQKLNEVGNATHLYENVINALEKMKKAKYKRRALLVITDAYDTSGKELEDLRARIAEQEIQVFTCGVRSVSEDLPNPTAEPLFQLVLRVLSVDTGGLSIVVDLPELQSTLSIEQLIAFSQIMAMELRGQYTVTYNTDQTGPLASRFVRVRSNIPQLRIRLRRDADEPLAKSSK
jgi:Ca-activated chloride channel family protein